MLASELYALSQGFKCGGKEKCHYCLGPCSQKYLQDDWDHGPFKKSSLLPRYPGGRWMCEGCYRWGRRSLTLEYLGGGYKDGQTPKKHSWLITPESARGLVQEKGELILEWLLRPKLPFCLSIVTGERIPNLIHLALVNDQEVLKADTELVFTIDRAEYSYSVFELEQAIKDRDAQGKLAGVRALLGLYLPPEPPGVIEEEAKGKAAGAPGAEDERARQFHHKRMKRPLR